MSNYNTLKGVQDIFPPDIFIWNKIENTAKEVFHLYRYNEIRIPVIEPTEIFLHSIGETTDIVEKEMYTFSDKAQRSITLRPEGTASVVRSYVQHHLYNQPSPQKYYYLGPMFRYERPQKGRLRQFYQIGVEAFGSEDPRMDAEIISMLSLFFRKIGLKHIRFEINSIGCKKCRPSYRSVLVQFFSDKETKLCPDCKQRIRRNPLRVLDCKVERCIALRKGAPLITDYLCDDCREHYEKLKFLLNTLKIPYLANPEMARGLDYYTRTTFEATTELLGAQNAVVAGGRYDDLVEQFGGPLTPATGFAMGMERLVYLLKDSLSDMKRKTDIFFAVLGNNAENRAMKIHEKLRSMGITIESGDARSSLKSQLRRADRIDSSYVIIVGDEEIAKSKVLWKRLSDGEQGEIELDNPEAYLTLVENKKKEKLKKRN